MKKEIIIYCGLLVMIGAFFSFELMVKQKCNELTVSAYEAERIHSIAFDIPANVFFIEGKENKIILEGDDASIDELALEHVLGHYSLKKTSDKKNGGLIDLVNAKKQSINMYVIAEDISQITVINKNGCLARNGIFNGDRGIIEVNDTDIIQFAQSSSCAFNSQEAAFDHNQKESTLTSCL